MKLDTFYFILFICLLSTQIGTAQQLTTNENGQKIIVYEDGSWKYASESDVEQMTQRTIDQPVAVEKEGDADLEIAINIAEVAAAEEAEAIRMEEDAKYARLLIEDELKDAEGSDDFFDDEIKEIKNRLKEAKKQEKKAKSVRKSTAKKAKEANKLITMSEKDRTSALQKYEIYHRMKKTNVIASESSVDMFPGGGTEEPSMNPAAAVPEVRYSNDSGVKKILAKYNRDNDVLFHPPKQDCQLTFDGIDEFSGKKRKDVESRLFFTYTNEELRSIFKDRDYIICTGYLSSLSGGLKFLTLNVTIASKNAQREYGILEKGGLINIKLLDGSNVKLVNNKTNMGTENPLEGSVTYRAQYLVSSDDEKKLKKSEVDKVRMIWSSGYEDYEIYELDFFMDQFKCLGEK